MYDTPVSLPCQQFLHIFRRNIYSFLWFLGSFYKKQISHIPCKIPYKLS